MMGKVDLKKSLLGNYSLAYPCPHCDSRLSSPIDEAGTNDSCPDCTKQFVVPGIEHKKRIGSARESAKQKRQENAGRKKAEQEQRLRKVLIGAGQLADKKLQELSADRDDVEEKPNAGTTLYVIAAAFALAFLIGSVFVAPNDGEPASQPEGIPSANSSYAAPSTPRAPQLPPVKHLLSSGDGHDWHNLSQREKMRLCVLIEETIGRHSAWTYRTFLQTFYDNARDLDASQLNKDIAEVAAVAAAMEISED